MFHILFNGLIGATCLFTSHEPMESVCVETETQEIFTLNSDQLAQSVYGLTEMGVTVQLEDAVTGEIYDLN